MASAVLSKAAEIIVIVRFIFVRRLLHDGTLARAAGFICFAKRSE
jgi:hypothetical protein